VWPWIVQIGHNRAGWYSHDWVERLFGIRYAEGHPATRVHPEFQDLRIGDKIPYAPCNALPVVALEPERHLIIGNSVAWVLQDLDAGRTRLIVRTRGYGWFQALFRKIPVLREFGAVIDYLIGEPLHHYMENGMCTGIAERARTQADATAAAPKDASRARAVRLGGVLVRVGRVYCVALALYLAAVRPRLSRWGATDDEVSRTAPGDQAVANPHTVTTRGVTIRAQPDEVWPWLVQMGAGRGGLYSYDWLDRLFGYIGSPSSDQILPQFQELAVGDVIPLGKGPGWRVIVADRDHALVVEPVKGQVTWAWLMDAIDADTTRLISRVRTRVGSKPVTLAFAPAIDLPWLLMERAMLHGVKRRAENLASSLHPELQ
jgi:hypothetical protein